GRIVDFVLSEIAYSFNNTPVSDDDVIREHARVQLRYQTNAPRCVWVGQEAAPTIPIGAALTYETGDLRVTGAWILTDVVTEVLEESGWREVRDWSLGYSYTPDPAVIPLPRPYSVPENQAVSCDGPAAPRRFLVAISDGIGPAVTYRYGHLPNTTPTVRRPLNPQGAASFQTSRCCFDYEYRIGFRKDWAIAGYYHMPLDVNGDG